MEVEEGGEEDDTLLEEKFLPDEDVEQHERRSIGRGIRRRIPEWIKSTPSSLSIFQSISWIGVCRKSGLFFVPSFLQGPEARTSIRPAKLHPTAYLDGMRGMAALGVFFGHYAYQIHTIGVGWGALGRNYEILRLPIIRLWYQGSAGVSLFFIISGYALSYRSLKLLRSGKTYDCYQAVGSTLFRRYARLFLPPAASTLIIVVLIQIGAYDLTREFSKDKTYLRNKTEHHPRRLGNLAAQLWHWMKEMWMLCKEFVWTTSGGGFYYDGHLWTIPVEFRNSLYLFLTILGTAHIQTRFRFLLIFVMVVHAYTSSRWDFILFVSGLVLAEVDHIRGAHQPPPALPIQTLPQPKSRRVRLSTLFWILVNVLGLWFLSQPDGGCDSTPGWVTLCGLIPEWWDDKPRRYYQSFGAVLFTASVGHLSLYRRFFETGAVQYFGKISYALYLTHAAYIHTLGYLIEMVVWKHITGIEGSMFHIGFALAAFINVPLAVWVADIFWRGVDSPCVRFAKWVETKVRVKTD